MTEKRVQFSNIVKNQLPSYVKEEFPLISEFLSQYYVSQEFKGAPADLIQNIDQYIKVDNFTNTVDSVILINDQIVDEQIEYLDLSFSDTTIKVDLLQSPSGTDGFPDSYGLLQIDDEIITYTSKTFNSFVGCIRGFSGITSYTTQNKPDQLTFKSSESSDHIASKYSSGGLLVRGSEIINLSSLFLKEFLSKIKYQLSPGFEGRSLYENLNQSLFFKQIRDFYQSKGTDESFKILFKILYGSDVKVTKPKENLFRPSDAHYRLVNNLVVESLSGDPLNLVNQSLIQNEYENIPYARSPITYVEKIVSKNGNTYYKLSLDSGYNRDIITDGSTIGKFTVHPKTKIIGSVSIGATVFDVDSTVGFPNNGELLVSYSDQTTGIISYRSKTLNQFFDCSEVPKTILDGASVGINTYAFAQDPNTGSLVKLRITSVLNSSEIIGKTRYHYKNDTSIIRTLGTNVRDVASKNWFFNTPISYKVKNIIFTGTGDTYKITVDGESILKIGDKISIISNSGFIKNSTIIDIESDNTFTVSGQGNIPLNETYIIKRSLLKSNFKLFPNVSLINSNIQNIYKLKEKTFIASPSIPSYSSNYFFDTRDRSIVFNGVGIGSTNIFNISPKGDHGFYTGDKVYYTPSISGGSLFSEGLYFIKRIDPNKISLAKSLSNINKKIFVSVSSPTSVTNSKIELFDLKSKTLNTQKLLREISPPINDGNIYETNSGFTGILINGVEILNYKANETIYYGKIEEVEVTSPGLNYDIINPPILSIEDFDSNGKTLGTGATGFCAVKGSLQEIRIIDPGFDYVDTPIIKITGGNGVGAKAYANMKLVSHESTFNSQANAELVGIGSTVSTIGFTTYHKFRNAEKVIYKTDGQKGVSGLSTDSSYYVSVKDNYTVKLHNTLNDAVSGINTVVLSSFGIGNHKLKSYNKKFVLGSINVENPGSGYENKKRTTTHLGINTSNSQIEIKSHGYNSGETITYTTDFTPISGLTTKTNYIVTKVDNNSFKLSNIGIGTDNYDFYYKTKQYINFNSAGLGTHVFNYPEIKVEIIGNSTFESKVQPIFRGEITSVHLRSSGVGYGSSEIINFYRQPIFNLKSGKSAKLTPIVSADGTIKEVLVDNIGSEYNSPPTLFINGSGSGAVLTPIISDGKLIDIKVIEGGFGYTQSTTSIDVIPSGSLATFNAKIQSWTINLYKKYYASITEDDGFITNGFNKTFGLQYSYLYAPRKLREIIYPLDGNGNKIYEAKDLNKENDIEINSKYHSPIIGWAYDGNPIYGPYGYSTKNGYGTISQLKSGYEIKSNLNQDQNRPSTNLFEEGFFVEDFVYYKKNDETILDENNGRFCVTPEFPNGTYAYFATFELTADDRGKFIKYKQPKFPYLIGNSYKSKPISFNFLKNSNQDDFDLNHSNWIRNTYFYNLISEDSSYSYITIPNNLNQTVDVKFASPGIVESVDVISGGSGYRVNDVVIFDNIDTRGSGASARVSKIKGKDVDNISVGTSSIPNIELYPGKNKGDYIIFSENPHNFNNNDEISVYGLSTTSSLIEGSYSTKIFENILTLSGIGTTSGTVTTGIGSVGVTGIVTYINVNGNLSYPNIRENDVLSIENEKIKVLNIDELNSRIRVIRSHEGTVGIAHSALTKIKENSRKLLINSGYKTTYDYRINKQLYFNPVESVGLGTLSGVGIGTTIKFSNPGAGITQTFIPTRSIYIPNHELETGDLVTYSSNGGSPLSILITGTETTTLESGSSFYIIKISNDLIGIATVRVGLGSTGTFVGIASTQRSSSLLYFVGVGTGVYHSFKTNFDVISGTIERNIVTVSCSSTHGLTNNDTVEINVNPSISTTFTFKYDNYNRKVVVNPKSFSAIDVNVLNDSINIPNHGFNPGQKIIHTSSSPSGGLQNNKEYFVNVVDKNNIKLSNEFYDATKIHPSTIEISSASFGTISAINPPLTLYKNSEVIFDLSDSSLSYKKQSQKYSAFSLDFYKDSNFTQIFEFSGKQKTFEIKKVGIVGITSDAKVILAVNENIPQNLYYKLTPIYNSSAIGEGLSVNIDSEVLSNNEIKIQFSNYNGKKVVTSTSSTTFTYTLPKTPEVSSYVSSGSNISYTTTSKTAFGAISEIEVTNKGTNYYALPGISTVISTLGIGAILESTSNTIGEIKKSKINDIGFDFPTDFTLKPSISLNQIIKIEPLSSLKSIKTSSFGRGYLVAPKLLIFDGKTNKLVPEIDLKFTLEKINVEILKNAYSLNNVTPKILPIQNSNGVGIGSVSYNSETKEVTVKLAVGFSTAESFPFKVNDKVMIENISVVGAGETVIGYNSENYNYKLFTITSVTENRGSIGSVVYSLDGILPDSQIPGIYDPIKSSGRIIPEKYFPVFNIELEKNNYLVGETIRSKSITGYVDGWNPKINHLRAVSKEDFVDGEIIEGLTSKTQGIAKLIQKNDSFFKLDSTSLVDNQWEVTAGFLNTNSERIQDSDFYQNFSYSIKSDVSYDKWEDAISTLNHTVGFKKFSEYQLETTNSLGRITPDERIDSSIDVISDIIGFANLNCVFDFDLVTENSIISNEKSFSNEITFSSRILTDYYESVGNRVLSIDDLSPQFNSNPRSTRFSEVYRFLLSSARAQKYITYVSDKRYSTQRQLMLVSLLHDGSLGFINQYARLESAYDLGSFDFFIDGSEGILTFNPTKYAINDYNISTLSYNLKDSMLGIGTSNFGNSVILQTSNGFVSTGSTTIASISTTYNAAKILVEIAGSNGNYEFDELNLVHDGINVELLEYGQITDYPSNLYSSPGLGTYHPYISGSNVKVDFYPNTGIAITFNTIQTVLGGSISDIGTYDLKNASFLGMSTSISSSASPSATSILNYSKEYDCSYCIVEVSDITNNRHQLSEIVLLDDQTEESIGEIYIAEFANIETHSELGTFGARKNGSITELTFTPKPNIDVRVSGFLNALRHQDDTRDETSFNDESIKTSYGSYFGTERDVKRSFNLTHKGNEIFRRAFNGSDSSIVDINSNTIKIPNHFFVTGEKVTYTYTEIGSQPIEIETTDFGPGIGITDKLPSSVYIIKVNENTIGLSRSTEDALNITPKFLNIKSVGAGSSHVLTSINQNAKAIISIDNIIQSPIVSTAQTSSLAKNTFSTDDILYFTEVSSFFGGDLIKIGNEIMKIESVGVGSTNSVLVRRPRMGTNVSGYSTGSLVTKVIGNYNIVENTLNFEEAPYGIIPLSSPTADSDERDWLGISVSSSFHGRTFLRSGITNDVNEPYSKNYVLNDISEQFDGKTKDFRLKSDNLDVNGISKENAIILLNDIFQESGISNDYNLLESAGITTISFTGTATSTAYDVNTSSLPAGGIIISIGSTEGFGYQPLVSAGGTAIVSGLGTISSVSIGNSGSGYRSKSTYEIMVDTSYPTGIGSTKIYLKNDNSVFSLLNLLNTGSNCTIGVGTFIVSGSVITSIGSTFITIGSGSTSAYSIASGTQAVVKISNPPVGFVNVGIANSSVGVSTVTHIGYSTIISGNISKIITITNSGAGYTSTNPPYVIIDDPISYSNLPLVYSSSSPIGVGTQATVDIIIGRNSSVIDFEIKNLGYGYNQGEILTISSSGLFGIPKDASKTFKEFQIFVEKTSVDKFSGWSIGELQVLDKIENLFDGSRVNFPLRVSGSLTSIFASKGSNINIQDNLLVFINDVLQIPGKGYIFDGGSSIIFTEPPKFEDNCKIIFYKGSGDDVDVIRRNILETVKVGDELTIGYDSLLGQNDFLQQSERITESVESMNLIKTLPYYGPGLANNSTLYRPITWCRQTEDKIINEKEVNKDREIYEPLINPFAYIIKPVGIGSTIIYVDTIRPFFDPKNESDISLSFQDKVTFISQEPKSVAIATAVVSKFGTISSVIVSDGGVGYTDASVSFASTIGISTSTQASGSAIIGVAGTVTGVVITNPGVGYTSSNPPSVLISSPSPVVETNSVSSFVGDSGVIVGFGTTTQSSIDKLIFDFYIPQDSFLRNISYVGTGVTISSIGANDYFIIYKSNVGVIGTSFSSLDTNNNLIGFSTTYIDNVYQVDSASIVTTNINGIGTSYVKRIYARIASGIGTINFSSTSITFDSTSSTFTFDNTTNGGAYTGIITTSNYFGNFTWGKITLKTRVKENQFNFYGNNGIVGITSSAIVQRTNPLKFKNYLI